MSSILNISLSFFKKTLNDLIKPSTKGGYFDGVESLPYSKEIKFERLNRQEGEINPPPNPKEAYVLQDLILRSGNRFLTSDDKAYITKKGLDFEKSNPSKNIKVVTESNHPILYNIVKQISDELDEPMPSTMVLDQKKDDERLLAFSSPALRRLRFSKNIIEKLDENELRWLVAHEYSHLYDSMRSKTFLSGFVNNLEDEIGHNIRKNGFDLKSFSISLSLFSQLNEFIKNPEYPVRKEIKYQEMNKPKFRKTVNGLKALILALPAIKESALRSKSMEYTADALGVYFSGEEAAKSALTKLYFTPTASEQNNTSNDDRRNIISSSVKNVVIHGCQKVRSTLSTHPNYVERVDAIKRGSFSESAKERVYELKEKPDFER